MILPVATLSVIPMGIDWIEVPPADAIDSLKAAGFQISLWPYPHTWPYVLNVTGQSPFRDKLVRQAANYAVDRERLVELLNHRDPGTRPLSDRAPGLWRAEEPLYSRSVPGFSAPAAFHYPKPEE
jgi:ABC-type transport system substrate-binding protein